MYEVECINRIVHYNIGIKYLLHQIIFRHVHSVIKPNLILTSAQLLFSPPGKLLLGTRAHWAWADIHNAHLSVFQNIHCNLVRAGRRGKTGDLIQRSGAV